MLFAVLKNVSNTKLKPTRFSAEYKENQWIYTFTFSGTVEGFLK